MQREPLISIIIPIYNVEDYLERCLDSVLRQTYPMLQVILVDDGSTDNSGEIAEKYASDHRVEIYHKSNGGLADARNFGLKKAKGTYILFVDSDDWISENFVEHLYRNLCFFHADISACVYKRTDQEMVFNELPKKMVVEVWDAQEALRKMLRQEDGFSASACAMLYDIRLFQGIRYPKGKYVEDFGTTYKILARAERMVRSNLCLYHYYMRDESIVHQKFQPEFMVEYFFAQKIVRFIQDQYPCLIKDAISRQVGVCFHLYLLMSREQRYQYVRHTQVLLHTIKKYRFFMLVDPGITRKVKAGCLLSYFGMGITEWFYQKLEIRGKG